MAASMGIYEVTGSSYTPGSTGVNKANSTIWFRANDSTSTGSDSPVARPTSGTTQSYEKWLHLRVTGTFTSVSNPRFYVSSHSPSTGVTFYARTTGTNTFATPAAPASNASGTDVANYTSGAPKSLYVFATGSSGSWTAAGDVGDFLVAWASVNSSASAGSMGSSVFVFSWDEV
jgi:hypothetical protein